MDCSVKNLGDCVLVTTVGRVDLSNADAFKDVLTGALAPATAIVIDFSQVDYISSAGLRALLIVFKAAKAAGKGFGLAGLRPLVLEVFVISRFNLVFPLFDQVRDAVGKLAPGALPALGAG